MNRIIFFASLQIFSLSIIILPIQKTFACTPLYIPPQQLFDRSEAIFLGKVIAVSTSSQENLNKVTADVYVEKYWKGNIGRITKIASTGIYTCGTAFNPDALGNTYLIHATGFDPVTNVYTVHSIGIRLASSSADTIKDLRNGKIPSENGTSIPTTVILTFDKNLTLGSTGYDVERLQSFLESKGFLTMPPGVTKGYFGQLTRAAVVKYQISQGITPAVGYVGPITRTYLNK